MAGGFPRSQVVAAFLGINTNSIGLSRCLARGRSCRHFGLVVRWDRLPPLKPEGGISTMQ